MKKCYKPTIYFLIKYSAILLFLGICVLGFGEKGYAGCIPGKSSTNIYLPNISIGDRNVGNYDIVNEIIEINDDYDYWHIQYHSYNDSKWNNPSLYPGGACFDKDALIFLRATLPTDYSKKYEKIKFLYWADPEVPISGREGWGTRCSTGRPSSTGSFFLNSDLFAYVKSGSSVGNQRWVWGVTHNDEGDHCPSGKVTLYPFNEEWLTDYFNSNGPNELITKVRVKEKFYEHYDRIIYAVWFKLYKKKTTPKPKTPAKPSLSCSKKCWHSFCWTSGKEKRVYLSWNTPANTAYFVLKGPGLNKNIHGNPSPYKYCASTCSYGRYLIKACNSSGKCSGWSYCTVGNCSYPGSFKINYVNPYCDIKRDWYCTHQNNKINWSTSSYAQYYEIYRKVGSNWKHLKTKGCCSYWDERRPNNTSEKYKVRACNTCGCRGYTAWSGKKNCGKVGSFSLSVTQNCSAGHNWLSWTKAKCANKYVIKRNGDYLGTNGENQRSHKDTKTGWDGANTYEVCGINERVTPNETKCTEKPVSACKKDLSVGFIANKVDFSKNNREMTLKYDANVVNNPPPGFADLLRPEWFEQVP